MRLPNEYQEVEYIQSTGTQYIDTGVVPNFNTKVEFDFIGTASGTITSGFIYGSRVSNSSASHTCIMFPSAKDWYPQFSANTSVVHLTNTHPDLAENGVKYKIRNSKDGFYINNTLIKSYPNETELDGTYPMYLFALNQSGTIESRTAKIKLYSFRIYENDVLIREYIPCYRKADDEIGLYDLINNVFYTNEGTGTFIKGENIYYTADKLSYLRETKSLLKDKINDLTGEITDESTFAEYAEAIENLYDDLPKVSGNGTEVTLANVKAGKMKAQPFGNISQAILPDTYQQVEYIESSGTQYIDLNFIPNQNTGVEIKFQKNSNTIIAGSRTSLSVNSYGIALLEDGIRSDYGSQNTTIYRDLTNAIKIYKNKNNVYINDNLVATQNNENFTCPGNLYLFGVNNNGTELLGSNTIFYCKIYDNNILIRYLVPCYRKSDSVIGLYDLVNNVFYTNQGTETFTKGNDVPNPSYPQEIKNVTGDNNVVIRGKNSFDWQNANIFNSYYNPSTNKLVSDSLNAKSIYIKCKPNSIYTISKNSGYTFRVATTNVIPARNVEVIETVANHTSSSISINTSNNANFLWVNYFNENNGDTGSYDDMMKSIQIEEGSTATPYEPYITPIEKALNLSGKNLLNGLEQGNVNSSGQRIESQTKLRNLTIIKVKPNTQYILNGIGNNLRILIFEYDENEVFIQRIPSVWTNMPYSFTTSQNTSYINLTISYLDERIITVDNVTNMQLEQGSTTTSYEPYYNYKLMEGDYITEDCIIHHKKGKVIFDGSENWVTHRAQSWGSVCYLNFIGVLKNTRVISSHFEYYKNLPDETTNVAIGKISSNSFADNYLYIGSENENKNALKTWLSNNPTIVEYDLVEENIETIPNTIPLYNQVKALFNIQNSNAGTLIVETESNEENARLKVATTALQSWEVNN